jgi:PAS domain S-box-containing protein
MSLHNRVLRLHNQASQAFNSSLKLDKVLITVLEEVRQLMGVVGSSIWLTEEETGELVCEQATGAYGDTLRGWRLAPGEGLAGWVANHGEGLITGDSDIDERHHKKVDLQIGRDMRSILTLPLLVKGYVIGVLQLVDAEPERFDATHLTLLKPLAGSAAIAIYNARLYEKGQQEITIRKQTEEALRVSEEKYRIVLEANPDPVVVYNLEGKVIYFNPAFIRVFGWNLDECLGRKMDVFVPEEAWPETKTMINKVLAGESFSGIETRRYTKEGTIIPVSISGAIYRIRDGSPGGSIVNIRDISEQKKLDGQLQQAKKMEAIGLLAGGVAHDLNNVLAGSVTYPDLLLMQIPEDSPLREPILTIQESGIKAAAIVQDLLTLARRGVVTKEVVNLNAVISEYLTTPEHEKLTLYHPGVEVKTDWGADLLNISGSPLHLSKTVMNLAFNAAEAMTDGGKIFISTENRYIDRPISGYDSMEEGDYVILTVTDTGTGISTENIDRIFEPFYTKKVMGRSGTGLGLAVVWNTVKDHNGYIDVQSTQGKGTTFTLYFPATSRKIAKDKVQLHIEDYTGKGESILVVDDIKEQRDVALNLLTALGYVADTVSSGEEAVEYLKAHNVDLIVLDMIMDPGIDGLDTYRKILEVNPRQKAIIASGFSETDRVREAQRLGAGVYVQKPYTMEKISLAVKNELAI